MLVLGQINVKKYPNLEKARKLLKAFSMLYVKAFFASKKKENKTEVKRLLNLQTYIQNTYNTNQSIYSIILNILQAINISNNGQVYINKEQLNTIKISKIFKLICFGNLELQKSAIFNDAIDFGINQMRMKIIYGY